MACTRISIQHIGYEDSPLISAHRNNRTTFMWSSERLIQTWSQQWEILVQVNISILDTYSISSSTTRKLLRHIWTWAFTPCMIKFSSYLNILSLIITSVGLARSTCKHGYESMHTYQRISWWCSLWLKNLDMYWLTVSNIIRWQGRLI